MAVDRVSMQLVASIWHYQRSAISRIAIGLQQAIRAMSASIAPHKLQTFMGSRFHLSRSLKA